MTNEPWNAPDGFTWVFAPALGLWVGRKTKKPSTRSTIWSSTYSPHEPAGTLDLLTPNQMADRYPNYPKDQPWTP